MSKTYFISDAHLGSWAVKDGVEQERKLVKFLDSIKVDAKAVYLLGDMFDFWYEYRYTVPKGYTRFLGKLSELSDSGIDIHFFTGNHDIWCEDYFEKECGMTIHKHPITVDIDGKTFYLAHGDGLGDPNLSFRVLRCMFHGKVLQVLFSSIHPRWAIPLGLSWAKHSYMTRKKGNSVRFMGTDKEYLFSYSKEYANLHPEIDFFIYGHRHIKLDIHVNDSSRMLILGDWISSSTFAVFDGESIELKDFFTE